MLGRAQFKVPSPRSFAERVEDLLGHVEYRRAETEAELDAILRLRYEAYLKEGAISPSESGRLRDAFDDVDNVYNFGVFIDGELASALRLHRLYSVSQQSPAIETFGDFLAPQLKAGKLILDPTVSLQTIIWLDSIRDCRMSPCGSVSWRACSSASILRR